MKVCERLEKYQLLLIECLCIAHGVNIEKWG